MTEKSLYEVGANIPLSNSNKTYPKSFRLSTKTIAQLEWLKTNRNIRFETTIIEQLIDGSYEYYKNISKTI